MYCCQMERLYFVVMKHVLGNLLKEDYDSIISSEQMRLVKRGMNIDESLSILCRKCMFAKIL